MYTLCVCDVRDQPGVLICSLCVSPLAWDVVEAFTVLTFISSNHIYRLLEEIEVKILIAGRRCKIKVSVYKRLATGIK